MKRAQKRREKHLANGDSSSDNGINGNDDDNYVGESEELTEAQKESRLNQIAQEYAVPGRPTSGNVSPTTLTKSCWIPPRFCIIFGTIHCSKKRKGLNRDTKPLCVINQIIIF